MALFTNLINNSRKILLNIYWPDIKNTLFLKKLDANFFKLNKKIHAWISLTNCHLRLPSYRTISSYMNGFSPTNNDYLSTVFCTTPETDMCEKLFSCAFPHLGFSKFCAKFYTPFCIIFSIY